uniref:Cleavage stimulation factor subunit 3 n=1 Tax=Strigamia maritima TaxID=126957 RepID=T1J5R7_STRMM
MLRSSSTKKNEMWPTPFSHDNENNIFQEQSYLPDKLKKAEKRLEENPYDVDAWSMIIRDAQTKKPEDARPLYEKLVSQFPNSGRYWKLYIEQEVLYLFSSQLITIKARNFERVEKIQINKLILLWLFFISIITTELKEKNVGKCLMKVLNIDLWKCYLTYVKDTKGSLPTYREKMAQAYDFALDKMGMDIMSYQIWSDYIGFLKGVEAVGSYAENQRITAVRKVYQRGCVNPMINIEQLWKEYILYEQSINTILADKMIADRSRDYMNARRVAKEYEAVTRGLNRNAPSIPPQNSPEEAKQVELWKKYIAWEKNNPLRTEDHAMITKRVMFAYEQCLLCLGHHPDIWYEAALFLEQSSKLLTEKGDVSAGKMFSEEAATIYERATNSMLQKNMLLYFAYADFEEGRMKYDKVHQIYNKFAEISDCDPTLAYIQYMKFARRAEGIKSARSVFKKSREDIRSNHHIYVAASLMEYYCSKDKNVAIRIFELGFKKYADNPNYILAYIDFLSHLNEDNNTRVLFERVLTSGSLPPHKSVDIWNRFLEFESNIGDLSSVLKVEKRRAAVIDKLQEFEGKETALLVDRYKYMDLYPCTMGELKAIGYKELSKQQLTSLPTIVSVKREPIFDDSEYLPKYPKPDTTQMIPFKPKQIYSAGSHPIPGGVFPLPPEAAHLLTMLPPPICFHGPFVSIDQLIDVFNKCKLPDDPPKPSENGVEKDSKYLDQLTTMSEYGSRKRKTAGVDSDDDESLSAPPAFDLYRSRQQKRVR